jgi:hypothetical protein
MAEKRVLDSHPVSAEEVVWLDEDLEWVALQAWNLAKHADLKTWKKQAVLLFRSVANIISKLDKPSQSQTRRQYAALLRAASNTVDIAQYVRLQHLQTCHGIAEIGHTRS